MHTLGRPPLTSQELEKIVRRAAEIADRGETFEDDRVELKGKWPEPPSEMARQLAAHANARGRQEFVWLIGIRQKSGVVGAPAKDGGEWLPPLRACFDQGVIPTLSAHENLEFDGRNVIALAWDPHDPPYVIKFEEGRVRREVPWREGEMVRTAGRKDLLRILEPIALAPALEVVPGALAWITARLADGGTDLQWSIRCTVRVTPRSSRPVVIPYGGMTCRLLIEGSDEIPLTVYMITNDGETPYRITGRGEVTFAAPASVELMSNPLPAYSPLIVRPQTIKAEILFRASGASHEARLTTDWQEPSSGRNDWWGYWVPAAEAAMVHLYKP